MSGRGGTTSIVMAAEEEVEVNASIQKRKLDIFSLFIFWWLNVAGYEALL